MRNRILLVILFLIFFPSITAQPGITNLRNISINASMVRITFNVTSASNASIYYGVQKSNLNLNETNASYLTFHNISLINLDQNTTYYFRVNVTNVSNSKNATFILNFTTLFDDQKEPVWSNNMTRQLSPVIYGNQSEFNVTWQDYNLSHAWIEHNFSGTLTNYSMTGNVSKLFFYYYNLTPGTYRYRFFANDTSKHLNYTTYFHYHVLRQNSSLNLTFDRQEGNTTLERGYYVLINASLISGDSYIYLYLNGSLINQSDNPIENVSLDRVGQWNITARYLQSENYTYYTITYFINVSDNLPPIFTIAEPLNDTIYSESSVWIDFDTDEEATCYYNLTGNYTLIDTDTWHVELLELDDSVYNITFKCTDEFNHTSYARVVNLTVDSTYPVLAIISPIYAIYNRYRLQYNYSVNDTNLDRIWYTANHGSQKIYLNATRQNITFEWPGKIVFVLYANDTASNYNMTNVTFYINQTFNISKWIMFFNTTISSKSVQVLNHTSDLSNNISVDQDLTLIINFTDLSLYIYNFSGLRTVWNRDFYVDDNDSYFEEQIHINKGTDPVDYIYSANFTQFYNTTKEYYAKAKFPRNISGYDYLYFCSGLNSCSVVSSCSSDYKENSTSACYNNTKDNVYVYLPYLGFVFGSNDTIFPTLTITSPYNDSVVNQSYLIPLAFTTNEISTCKYSLNKGTFTSLSGTTSFSTTFNSYSNTYQNISINCTDSSSNTGTTKIFFRINDTTYPDADIDVDNALTELSYDITTDEPSNVSLYLVGNTTKKSTSFTLVHQINFTNLKAGTRYNYIARVCDKIKNCYNYSGISRTESSDSTSSSSSSAATGASSSGAKGVGKLWLNPEAGEHVMDIPSSSIAFTRITFLLKQGINGTVMLTVYTTSPIEGMPALDDVYQYVKIDEDGITKDDITSAKILFKVSKEWITSNNIAEIKLNRYTNKWDALETRKLSDDSSYAYYESDSPGLSYFAVTGIKGVSQASNANESLNDITGEAIAAVPDENVRKEDKRDEKENTKSSFKFLSILITIIMITGILAVLASSLMQQSRAVIKKDTTELRDYVNKCKADGFNDEQIISHLVANGWEKDIVEPIVASIKTDVHEHKELQAYVYVARANGLNDLQIRENLKGAGWNDSQIENALK